jgi:hypothetical protein
MKAGLWDHAFMLSKYIGPAAMQDVERQFALCSLVDGSPLRTLYLLLARQPAGVSFSRHISLYHSYMSVTILRAFQKPARHGSKSWSFGQVERKSGHRSR